MLQSTKPQSLAASLYDSPAGLAAWLTEKFRIWSDNDGNVETASTRDELLTNPTLSWATQTIDSSMRLAYESAHVPSPNTGKRVDVPTAMAMLSKDLVHGPRERHACGYDVRCWIEPPRGGRFAEWEVPAPLADDLRAFFRPLR